MEAPAGPAHGDGPCISRDTATATADDKSISTSQPEVPVRLWFSASAGECVLRELVSKYRY